jgi:hypothetical protein
MSEKTVKVITSIYHPWKEDEDEPRLKSQEFDYHTIDDDMRDWHGDYKNVHFSEVSGTTTSWVPASDVTVAVEMLLNGYRTDFYAGEASSEPNWTVATWYTQEEYQDLEGFEVRKSAHLYGFTEDEEREIYSRVMKRN